MCVSIETTKANSSQLSLKGKLGRAHTYAIKIDSGDSEYELPAAVQLLVLYFHFGSNLAVYDVDLKRTLEVEWTSVGRMLKAPLVNPRAKAFLVLKCNCRTYNDNIGQIFQNLRFETLGVLKIHRAYIIFVSLFSLAYSIVDLFSYFITISNIFQNILMPLSRTYLRSPRNIITRIKRRCFQYPPMLCYSVIINSRKNEEKESSTNFFHFHILFYFVLFNSHRSHPIEILFSCFSFSAKRKSIFFFSELDISLYKVSMILNRKTSSG